MTSTASYANCRTVIPPELVYGNIIKALSLLPLIDTLTPDNQKKITDNSVIGRHLGHALEAHLLSSGKFGHKFTCQDFFDSLVQTRVHIPKSSAAWWAFLQKLPCPSHLEEFHFPAFIFNRLKSLPLFKCLNPNTSYNAENMEWESCP